MRSVVLKWMSYFRETLNSPVRVLGFCSLILLTNLVLDGSLYNLWSLHSDQKQLHLKGERLSNELGQLEMKIQRASDPAFMEREARDRFDLVSEGDLVFVFSDEDSNQ
ncbi:MAG: septum formation initiator family protein [Bdellovibrionales bacterium]|nr:septum formation initiator family protein [Bdellovibrionales bacterium]